MGLRPCADLVGDAYIQPLKRDAVDRGVLASHPALRPASVRSRGEATLRGLPASSGHIWMG